jgi:hypothetical protein
MDRWLKQIGHGSRGRAAADRWRNGVQLLQEKDRAKRESRQQSASARDANKTPLTSDAEVELRIRQALGFLSRPSKARLAKRKRSASAARVSDARAAGGTPPTPIKSAGRESDLLDTCTQCGTPVRRSRLAAHMSERCANRPSKRAMPGVPVGVKVEQPRTATMVPPITTTPSGASTKSTTAGPRNMTAPSPPESAPGVPGDGSGDRQKGKRPKITGDVRSVPPEGAVDGRKFKASRAKGKSTACVSAGGKCGPKVVTGTTPGKGARAAKVVGKVGPKNTAGAVLAKSTQQTSERSGVGDDLRDAKRGWGHSFRDQQGAFGSYPVHDAHDDESDPD